MKHREIFKIYSKQDLQKNKMPMFIIAFSIFLAMLVSLVIPQIQMSKQQYLNENNENLSKADLMVDVNYPSSKFDQKIAQYEKDGIKLEQISVTPSYFEYNGNQITVYLLSGYHHLKNDEVIISRNFANSNSIKVNDRIQLAGFEKKVRVIAIEELPADVTTDAEVAGYIKMKTSNESAVKSNNLLFISGRNGDTLKQELKKIENGYKYFTYQERQEKMYGIIDKEMGALSLISSVGFILSIAVLTSGIIMLIVKSKKDLANMMLVSIRKKDIIKAMKLEINIIIFIPLAFSIILCLPVSLVVMKLQNITVAISISYFTNLLKFIVFDVLLFLFYRNLTLHYIKKIDPILVQKGENGLEKVRFRDILLYLIPFPLTMVIYSALLQSGVSVATNIFVAGAILVTFLVVWIIVSLVSALPIWNHWNVTLYSFHHLRSNKMTFIIKTLNLILLVFFILVGFSLSDSLKQAVDENLTMNIPYNYAVRSTDIKDVENVLDTSDDIKGYMKMDYIITKVENEEISNKSILLMNENSSKGKLNFQIVKGEKISKNDTSQVLISEKYANAYKLTLGSELRVFENNKIKKYTIKGIYDSGGINVNWIIKSSDNRYDNIIYLVKYKAGRNPVGLKDCYISNMAMIGDYTLSQMNDFLKSFKLLSFLFILSAVVFNINTVYIGQLLLKKDLAIMEALGIKKDIVPKQIWVESITMTVTSLLISTFLYLGIVNIMVQFIAKGSTHFDFSILMIASSIAVVTVVLGYVTSNGATEDYLLEIRE